MQDLQSLAHDIAYLEDEDFSFLFSRLAMLPEEEQYPIIAQAANAYLHWERGLLPNRRKAVSAHLRNWWKLRDFNSDVNVPLDIQAKLLVCRFLDESQNLKNLEVATFGDLLPRSREVQTKALELARESKSQVYDAQLEEYLRVLGQVEERLAHWHSKPRAEVWLELMLTARVRGNYVYVPPFDDQEAEDLAQGVLDMDDASVAAEQLLSVKNHAWEALANAGLSDEMHAKILNQAAEYRQIPHYYTQAEYLPTLRRLHESQSLASPVRVALRLYSLNYAPKSFEEFIQSPELNTGEAWSDAFLARLDTLPAEQRQHWPTLVAFARTATTGKPSAKWLGEGQQHLNAVGADTFRHVLSESLPLLSRPRTFPLREDTHYTGNPNLLIDEFNAQSLKGLLWLTPLAGSDAALAHAVAGVVDSALKKVAGVGPRAPKVANAAVYALSQMESDAALSALARLSSTVTFKGTLKEVQKGLEAVAKRLNTSPEDLLELGVPTLGLTSVGERLETWGDVEMRFTVDAAGAKLSFSKGGKPLKSVPASVKKDYADDLKELKAAQKEAEKAVSALSARLDSLMITGKTWRGDVWQERYLHHPLAGTLARRLIWLVDMVPTFWHDGEMRSVNNHTLEVHPDSDIQLWHPISQPLEEVLAWRDWLETLEARQPFKQAWREVYLLTDAERRTGTYSNRFAGHILKQHQFNQLAALRGWRNKLRLMVDDSYPPATRDLPEYGLRAEYWIEGVGDDYGTDTTESGSYLRVRTDQLRFYPIDAPENLAHASGGGYEMWVSQERTRVNPLPLEQIPPLVLSEIMRDVDLFVGVASIGNDPTWQDGGPAGRFRDYWQSYSFGELTETAKTRAEYLARLLPRLKIKDRLTLEGRFLKVRGDLRSYKIHLGSSNILMEPNDQYLCIIPGGKGGSGPEMDFDGDRVLSLILSKAFLLSDDKKITDPVIVQQLGR